MMEVVERPAESLSENSNATKPLEDYQVSSGKMQN